MTQRENENYDPWEKRQGRMDRGVVLGEREDIQSERKAEHTSALLKEKRQRSKSRSRSCEGHAESKLKSAGKQSASARQTDPTERFEQFI